ncbi:hypothetical protein [Planomicrobium sp. CPCC 101110]|uniref:hypothetical protein n=1 Tax=Planomicrobium sp. CPCC 101110 TaxID=2599619 RepID=UPI0011B4A641|nr:hypothetical protein [Planomicrobium sp. CPCC 101110]TWT25933.1 hypothetical protein FQV30_09065 [Planomicrobium sp. CPCC 101110]
MAKMQWVLIGTVSLATFFCVCGQGTAYFLNEHFVPVPPVYYLTGSTAFGISLYLFTAFLLYGFRKNGEPLNQYLEMFLILFFAAAPIASFWAFFVTAMWWG